MISDGYMENSQVCWKVENFQRIHESFLEKNQENIQKDLNLESSQGTLESLLKSLLESLKQLFVNSFLENQNGDNIAELHDQLYCTLDI